MLDCRLSLLETKKLLSLIYPLIFITGYEQNLESARTDRITMEEELKQQYAEKEQEYAELFAHPYRAAARGYIDEVIIPENTRAKLISAFKMLENKVDKLPRKKHGNIPL